jgi:hypothetical protein
MNIFLGTIFLLSGYLLFINNTLYAILALQILFASTAIRMLEQNISNIFLYYT